MGNNNSNNANIFNTATLFRDSLRKLKKTGLIISKGVRVVKAELP